MSAEPLGNWETWPRATPRSQHPGQGPEQEGALGHLRQRSPTFLAPGTGFMEDKFSMDGGMEGCFRDDSSALIYYGLCAVKPLC